jgi:hypothetical protein
MCAQKLFELYFRLVKTSKPHGFLAGRECSIEVDGGSVPGSHLLCFQLSLTYMSAPCETRSASKCEYARPTSSYVGRRGWPLPASSARWRSNLL